MKGLMIFFLVTGMLNLGDAAAKPAPADSSLRAKNILPEWSFRTNLLWDAACEPNLGADVSVGRNVTVGISAGIKPWPRFFFWDWDRNNSRHWRNFAIVPQVRWWPKYVYDGFFMGADFVYTHFNVGNVRFPLGLYPAVRNERQQGSFWGAGLFVGWSWWIARHWRIEIEAGAAGGLAAYDRFDCPHCGTRLGSAKQAAVIPKLGVNITYNLLKRAAHNQKREERYASSSEPVSVPIPAPFAFVVHLRDVAEPTSHADSLSQANNWILPISRYRPLSYQTRPGRDSTLCVQYPTDSYELDLRFNDNARTLEHIKKAILDIREDGRTDEVLVSVVGLASIEGPVWRNDSLSVRRARSVAAFLRRETGLEARQFEVIGKGEAWDWFRAQVEECLRADTAGDTSQCRISPAYARRLKELMEREPDLDGREKMMRQDDSLFAAVKNGLLSDQRTAGYIRIYYGQTPDEATRTLNTDINALIKGKRWKEAVGKIRDDKRLAERVRSDAEALNAYGIALYFQALDDQDEKTENQALEMLRKASAEGSESAAQNLEEIETYGPARKRYELWKKMNNNHN